MIEQDPVVAVNEAWGARKARSLDFGRMITRMPRGVTIPKSVEEVASTVRWAAANGVELALRGGGHSQGGQCLTDRGVVIDTVQLNRVELVGPYLMRAQGGVRWGKIVDTLQGSRRLPSILVDISEATVGGTLAAGGLGTTSHRYGMQIGQIEQLEVVTGTGERVRCSSTRNTDLFNAVRGGQGQFGIITEAWIRLREAGERVRQYELRYRDHERFASDFERLVEEDRFDRLRAETRVHDEIIIMGAGIEYDRECDDARALDGLGYDKIISNRDTDRIGRAGMYLEWLFNKRFYYPWRDWLLPWEALRDALVQPWLNRDWVPRSPGSWIGVYPIGTTGIDAPLFMHPTGERMFSYSILSILDGYEKAMNLAERLKDITGALVALGGKSYLSGDVGYCREEWEQHYGDNFELGLRWKRQFDPKHVFGGEAMPFGSSPQAKK